MRVLLANGGGLHTAVALYLLRRQGHEVICAHVDLLGDEQSEQVEVMRQAAIELGAAASYSLRASEVFAERYVLPALWAHPGHPGGYNLSAALSRPVVIEHLVEFARDLGIHALAHGASGHRNDFVRFNTYARALAPDFEVLAPLGRITLPRPALLRRALDEDVPLFHEIDRAYQVDENLWGRSLTFTRLDPWKDPPEEAFAWTCSLDRAAEAIEVTLSFEKGRPVRLDGRALSLSALLQRLNSLAGARAIGRVDIIESRLLGFKRRALYEAPGATLLMTAHRALEDLTLPADLLNFKPIVDRQFETLTYAGHIYSPLWDALVAFNRQAQEALDGDVRLRLEAGLPRVVGRRSENSLVPPDVGGQRQQERLKMEARALRGLAESLGLSAQAFASLAPETTLLSSDAAAPGAHQLDPDVARRILRLAGIKVAPDRPVRPSGATRENDRPRSGPRPPR